MFELVKINDSLISGFYDIRTNYPHRLDDFFKSLENDQFKARAWIADEFNRCVKDKKTRSANIIGSGFAFYDDLLIRTMNLDLITYYEYDPEVIQVNWKLFKHLRHKIIIDQQCMDIIHDRKFIRLAADVVINLSCECMFDSKILVHKAWDKDTIFCMLGSNSFKKGNINVHSNIDEFIESTALKDILYSGELRLRDEMKYLVIGKK